MPLGPASPKTNHYKAKAAFLLVPRVRAQGYHGLIGLELLRFKYNQM